MITQLDLHIAPRRDTPAISALARAGEMTRRGGVAEPAAPAAAPMATAAQPSLSARHTPEGGPAAVQSAAALGGIVMAENKPVPDPAMPRIMPKSVSHAIETLLNLRKTEPVEIYDAIRETLAKLQGS